MADIFLSYAREDLERARAVVLALESVGWSVWWDSQILAGRAFSQVIAEEIRIARCVVVLWSTAASQSHWVQEEANAALGRGILVPVRLDSADPPFGFSTIHAVDLSDWSDNPHDDAWRPLANAVSHLLGVAAAPSPTPERRAWWRALAGRRSALACALLVPAVAAVVLAATHTRSVRVRLALTASSLSFTVDGAQALLAHPLVLQSVGAIGLRAVQLPTASTASRTVAEPTVLLTCGTDGTNRGSISLDAVPLPDSTAVTLSENGTDHGFQLVLGGRVPDIGVSVDGPVRILVPSLLDERTNFRMDRAVLRPDDSGVQLDLVLPPDSGTRSLAPLSIIGLATWTVEKIREGEFDPDRVVSTVLAGTLEFPALRRAPLTLSSGADLHLEHAVGRIQRLELGSRRLSLTFEGDVRGISTGHDLMPTRLEWLLTGHPAVVALALGAYLVAVATFTFRTRSRSR